MTLIEQLKLLHSQLLQLNEEVRVTKTLVGSCEREHITQFIHQSEQLVADIENATSVLSEHLRLLKEELDI